MATLKYKGFLIETDENWDQDGYYDIYIYNQDGELWECDFARSNNEKELIKEAKEYIKEHI